MIPSRIFGRPPRRLDAASARIAATLRELRPAQPADSGAAYRDRDAEIAYRTWAGIVTTLADELDLARVSRLYDRSWRPRFCYWAGLDSLRPGQAAYADTGGAERLLTEMEALRAGLSWPDGTDPWWSA